MVSRSSGRSVRGSMTSASTPCSSERILAAFWAVDGHARDADDGHVGALAADDGLAEVDEVVVVLGHLAALAVEVLVLDEDHGVVVADGRLQQALGVGRRRGHGDEQAGHVQEEGLEAVRVRRAELVAGALGHAHDERDADLAAEHVADVRGVVDDLVEREQREVDRHELDHGAQPGHGGTDAHADDGVLGDRGVAHALLAELLEQPRGDLEGAVEDADVLAHEHDVLVAQHLLAQGLVERLAVAQHARAGRLLGLCGGGHAQVSSPASTAAVICCGTEPVSLDVPSELELTCCSASSRSSSPLCTPAERSSTEYQPRTWPPRT